MTIDELTAYGMDRMDDEEIESYLKFQRVGVLALPTTDAPYLLPMAYGYDGGSHLYFNYVVGAESRKVELSDIADIASFLVYKAETMFHWRSVSLTGSIRRFPKAEYDTLTEAQIPAWRPELLETASETEQTQVYEFHIEEQTGIKHSIRPPSYWQQVSPDRSE